ncbi:MAG: type III secretion system chaperone [Kiritimatiellae bacterium]|nr:type III secretion system chaperone [Kiritimatiellia bacterium]
MNPFDALLADFAQKTGLEFGGPGTDNLDLEADGVAVCAQYRAERDDCVVFSLPLEDTEPDGPMLRRALELAANGGGTDGFFLGLKEGMFMLSAVLPLGGLSAEEFGRRLIALGAAQYAKDHLPGFPVEQLPGDGEDDPGMTAMKLDEVHFRVLLACMFDDEGKPDMAHLTERLGRFTENDIQALTRRTTPTPGTSSTWGEAPGGGLTQRRREAEAQRGGR